MNGFGEREIERFAAAVEENVVAVHLENVASAEDTSAALHDFGETTGKEAVDVEKHIDAEKLFQEEKHDFVMATFEKLRN